MQMEQVTATPHIAASTREAQLKVARVVAEEVLNFAMGRAGAQQSELKPSRKEDHHGCRQAIPGRAAPSRTRSGDRRSALRCDELSGEAKEMVEGSEALLPCASTGQRSTSPR
jgi:hypothetical protein